jgi:hypothetical protein
MFKLDFANPDAAYRDSVDRHRVRLVLTQVHDPSRVLHIQIEVAEARLAMMTDEQRRNERVGGLINQMEVEMVRSNSEFVAEHARRLASAGSA